MNRDDVEENVIKRGRLLIKRFEVLTPFLLGLCRHNTKVQPVAAQKGKNYVIYLSKLLSLVVELLTTIALGADCV